MRRLTIAVCGVVLLLITGCAGMERKDATAMERRSLYERLGGKPAIAAVVDDFLGNVAGDGRINARFARADIPRLRTLLVDQICQASGGPCVYTGQSMTDAHRGMRISDGEFGALVEDLVRSLDRFKVPAAEKNELLAALGGMKPQIVGQ